MFLFTPGPRKGSQGGRIDKEQIRFEIKTFIEPFGVTQILGINVLESLVRLRGGYIASPSGWPKS